MKPNPAAGPDVKNLMLAILAATTIMLSWQYFYERPHMAAQQAMQAQEVKVEAAHAPTAPTHNSSAEDATAGAPRIAINTPSLHGSLSLVGARLDDLTLANYHETIADSSPEVKLLSRATNPDAYFIELGVLPQSDSVKVPDATTRWQTKDSELTVDKPVTLTWNNSAGLYFERTIAVDEHFMFTITTRVRNEGGAPVTLFPYGLVSRNYSDKSKHYLIMHEGPLGVMNEVLEDITYKKLREDGAQKFDAASGWVGMTDKYWLTALIPDGAEKFDAQYKHFKRGENDAYQADLRGEGIDVPAGKTQDMTVHVFAGAKVVERLDEYRLKYNIPLFDRAVDFGSLYFLTKPIFKLLSFFHGIVGNFGVAILLLTCTIKLILFPLASKSMTAMSRTKQLAPKVTELRARHKADKMKMNQEVMALYKREKVNPMAGCLPILLQLPVFYSLYRVLFVTIEMRHAPFFGWIHDLSAPDPTNIFTAFGLIPWATPSFLHLGVWPLVMCATMVVQQRLNPKPADEIQAAVMSYMPFMFLFLFSGFPAGLVIYWAWNNSLTIVQQLFINARLTKKGLR